MAKKLGQRIFNNFGLKILAVLFAIILWIVVVNIDDPTQSQNYTISVTLENTDYLTSMDKYYEVLGGNNTVTFRVTAKRSVHEKLSNSDFSAVANLEKIEYDERTESYQVPVTITAERYSKDVEISTKQNYLVLALEDLSRTQKVITATTRGTVADGFALGDVSITSYNILKISGPASIVSQIDTVVAIINVDGVNTDVTDSVSPILYDAEGNTIDTTKLSLSLKTVSISAQILGTRDVPVQFETMGTVKKGYKVTGISYSPTEVRIKGESALLNTVNSIVVPQEVLDMTGLSDDLEKEVDISTYLPSGTSLVLGSDAKIAVTVTVEPVVTKEFEVPVKNITVKNLSEEYEVKFGGDYVVMEVSGTEKAMKGLKEKDITGTLDLGSAAVGAYSLSVAWDLDEADYSVSADLVPVTIRKQNEDTETEEDSGETGAEKNVREER